MFPLIAPPSIYPNDVSGFVAPIGGLGVRGEGGYIVASVNLSVGVSAPDYRRYLIDVTRWQIASGFGESPLAKGGMMGATSSRRTGYAHVWEADVVLDLRIQPAIELARNLEVELLFRLGSSPLEAGLGIASRYYWLPRAHLDQTGPTVDAGGKLRVRQRVAGCANCHLFLLPDEGNPTDNTTRAGAYQFWLSHAGLNQ